MIRIILISIITMVISISSGCSANERDKYSYIEIVENPKEAKLQKINDIETILTKGETIIGLKNGQNKYPNYDIKETPTIFILEDNGGELKKIALKTNNINEAVEFLKNKKGN